MGDNKCHGDHRTHLCALAGRGMVNDIKEIVTDPKVICTNCGRVADEGQRVCNPEPLEKKSGDTDQESGGEENV